MADLASKKETRDIYLARVDDLYAHVRDWTNRFYPDARIEEEQITLTEEPVDSYEAAVLVMMRPDYKTVRLVPRGRWIIGVEGRVDMKSDLGTETIVYLPEGAADVEIGMLTESGKLLEEPSSRRSPADIAEGWFFVQNRQLGMLPPLDANLFHRLLEVLGR